VLEWFSVEGNAEKLQNLVDEIATSRPRTKRLTTPSVTNPDGSVYVPPRLSAKQAVVAIACPNKERFRPFAVLDQVVGDGLERDRTPEESFDLYMDGLEAHFRTAAGQNGLDGATDSSEATATV
jgi:hypothetical protein